MPTSNPNFKVAVVTRAQSKNIQTSNPNSIDNNLSDDKILHHNFVDKCALSANKNKVVEVSVNPVEDEINLTDIFGNDHLTDSQTVVASQILVDSATASGNDTDTKSSVDLLPVVQEEVRSLIDAPTVVDELTESDVDESLGLAELFDEPKYITWDDVINLNMVTLEKWQKQCNDLKSLYKLAETIKQDVSLKAYFYIDNNILMRKKSDPDFNHDVNQIVVPKCLRKELLRLAHDVPMAAHLGINKTPNRLNRFFWWPSTF